MKPGREDDFVAAWVDLVVWSEGAFPGRRALLLRQREEPGVFLSVASAPSDDMMTKWRQIPGFTERLDALLDMATSHDARGFDQVMEQA